MRNPYRSPHEDTLTRMNLREVSSLLSANANIPSNPLGTLVELVTLEQFLTLLLTGLLRALLLHISDLDAGLEQRETGGTGSCLHGVRGESDLHVELLARERRDRRDG